MFFTFITAALIALLGFVQPTWANVYRCEVNGKKAEYQSTPCASGKSIVVKTPTSVSSPAQAKPHLERPPSAKELLEGQRAQERSRMFPLENRLSLDLPNTSLRAVLQLIADFAGYELVVGPLITENGDFNYKSVPASAILADLARRHDLLVRTDNHTITVTRK